MQYKISVSPLALIIALVVCALVGALVRESHLRAMADDRAASVQADLRMCEAAYRRAAVGWAAAAVTDAGRAALQIAESIDDSGIQHVAETLRAALSTAPPPDAQVSEDDK